MKSDVLDGVAFNRSQELVFSHVDVSCYHFWVG